MAGGQFKPREVFTERRRRIIVCRCVHGMTNNETAKHLDLSESVVRVAIRDLFRSHDAHCMEQVCLHEASALMSDPEAKPNYYTNKNRHRVKRFIGMAPRGAEGLAERRFDVKRGAHSNVIRARVPVNRSGD